MCPVKVTSFAKVMLFWSTKTLSSYYCLCGVDLGFNSTASGLQVCVYQLKHSTERNIWEQWQQLQKWSRGTLRKGNQDKKCNGEQIKQIMEWKRKRDEIRTS